MRAQPGCQILAKDQGFPGRCAGDSSHAAFFGAFARWSLHTLCAVAIDPHSLSHAVKPRRMKACLVTLPSRDQTRVLRSRRAASISSCRLPFVVVGPCTLVVSRCSECGREGLHARSPADVTYAGFSSRGEYRALKRISQPRFPHSRSRRRRSPVPVHRIEHRLKK